MDMQSPDEPKEPEVQTAAQSGKKEKAKEPKKAGKLAKARNIALVSLALAMLSLAVYGLLRENRRLREAYSSQSQDMQVRTQALLEINERLSSLEKLIAAQGAVGQAPSRAPASSAPEGKDFVSLEEVENAAPNAYYFGASSNRTANDEKSVFGKASYIRAGATEGEAWQAFAANIAGKGYQRFVATAYIRMGEPSMETAKFAIELDGKKIYESPPLGKSSKALSLDLAVAGASQFKIDFYGTTASPAIYFGDGGFAL
jgi:hypothetical protein